MVRSRSYFPNLVHSASFSSQTAVEPYVLRLPTTSRRLLLQWTVVLMVAETAPQKRITPACSELPHEERGVTLKQSY